MSVRKRRWKTALGEQKEAWVVDYADAQGKRRHRTFDKKKDADQFRSKTAVEVVDGLHVPDAASVTAAEAGLLWLQTIELAGRERATLHQYRTHVVHHITPMIGTVKLSRLTAPAVRQFEDRLLSTGRSASITRKIMTSLGAILGDAWERGLVGRNVVREMRGRRGPAEHRAVKRAKGKLKIGVDIPSREEIRIIVGELRGRARAPLLTAAFSGLRASEIRGLPPWDVDYKNSKLRVTQRADRYGAIGKPKSAAGERDVPLPPIVINTLREWTIGGNANETLMFPDLNGNPQAHNTLADPFKAAQIRAGFTVPVLDSSGKQRFNDKGEPMVEAKYGLHALRHFYASWCINRRADGGLELPAKMVQERLGHSSIQLTLDTYGHLFPNSDDGSELAAAAAFLMSGKD